jgi:hypothetical protein
MRDRAVNAKSYDKPISMEEYAMMAEVGGVKRRRDDDK